MIYTTTVTQKGQITLPKPIRDALKIKPKTQISIKLKGKHTLEIQPYPEIPNILDLAGTIEIPPDKKHIPIMKLREYMENNYERS